MTRNLIKFASLTLVAIISILVGFFPFDSEVIEYLITHYAYWIIFTAFLLFLFYSWKAFAKIVWKSLQDPKELTIGVALILLSIFLFTREDAAFKIYHDEPTLLSTAKTMHEKRSAIAEQSSKDEHGAVPYIDKRPLFFPLVVSLAHDVFGYRVSNAYWLNLLLCFLCLRLIYHVAFKVTQNRTASLAASIFMASHPLLAQNASGAGFELLNLCMILTSAAYALHYIEEPNTDRLNALVFSTILLCQARYESATFILPAIVAIGVITLRQKQLNLSTPFILSPLFFLPLAWQHKHISENPAFWQGSAERPTPFSLDYLSGNLEAAMEFFLVSNSLYPNSPIVGVVGIVATVFVTLAISKRLRSSPASIELIILPLFLLTVALNFAILMLYSWGQLNTHLGARLALPALLVFSIAFGICFDFVSRQASRWTIAFKLVLIAMFATGSFAATDPTYSSLNVHLQRYQWIERELESLSENRNILIIGSGAVHWNVLRYNSIPFERALIGAENIALQQRLGTYDDIYVIQYGSIIDTGKEYLDTLNQGYDLGPAFQLESVIETSIFPFQKTIISRLQAIKIGEIRREGGPKNYRKKYQTEQRFDTEVPPHQLEAWIKYLP